MKGRAELGINSYDKYERGTAQRVLQTADSKLSKLQNEQMKAQLKNGLPTHGAVKAEFGTILEQGLNLFKTKNKEDNKILTAEEKLKKETEDKEAKEAKDKRKALVKQRFKEGRQRALPYIDNVTNAILTSKTPHIPTPRLYDAVPLKTDVNVNAELAAVNQSQRDTTESLKTVTTDTGTLRANIIGAHAAKIQGTNKIHQYKTNTETELINQNAMNQQQTNNLNVDKMGNYDMLKMQRKGEIQDRISANTADAAKNSQQQVQEDGMRRRDNAAIELMKLKYKESGVYDRNVAGALEDYMAGKITYEELQTRTAKADAEMRKKKEGQANEAEKRKIEEDSSNRVPRQLPNTISGTTTYN